MKTFLTDRDIDFVKTQLKRNPTPDELSFIESITASVRSIEEKTSVLGSEENIVPKRVSINSNMDISIGQEHKSSLFHSNRKMDLFLSGTESIMDIRSGSVRTKIGMGVPSEFLHKKPDYTHMNLFIVQGNRDVHTISKIGKDLPVQFSHSIYKTGFGFTLFDITQQLQCGIKILMKNANNSLKLHQNRWSGILVAVNEEDVQAFQNLVSEKNIGSEYIGSLINDKRMDVFISKRDSVHFPLSMFGFLKTTFRNSKVISFSSNPQNPVYPALQKNYATIALKIAKKKINKPMLVQPKKSQISSSLASLKIKGTLKSLFVKNKICTLSDLEIGDKVSAGIIADITREISCMGIKPIGMSVAVGVNDLLNQDISGMFDSISYACRMLQSPLQNRMLYSHLKKDIDLTFTILGTGSNPDKIISKEFKQPSDFILMLGSLKGELRNTNYLKLKGKSFIGNEPIVDLNAEFRLQEVLQLAAEGNLIHSAASVEMGGISTTLIQCLRQSSSEIGARIYLNLKLRPDEILFGESHGVAIVTVSERDLMEFERICMRQRIPSTTIGRVTDDKLFLFNDWIKLSKDKLK